MQKNKGFSHWAEFAASAERNGDIKQAIDLWQKASMFAKKNTNKEWAEARQAHCEKQPVKPSLQ